MSEPTGKDTARHVDVDLAHDLTITVIIPSGRPEPDSTAGDADRGEAAATALPPGAVAAAARLAAMVHPDHTVLDLGSATGLAALAAAQRGATAISLCPDDASCDAVRQAAMLQQLDVDVHTFDPASEEPLPAADFVVISDLPADPALERVAAHRVLEALSGGARVLLAGRPGREHAAFELILATAGVRIVFGIILVRTPGERRMTRCELALIGPMPDTEGRDASTEPLTGVPR
jgi:ribosomal protein L11 methylase PrmA